MSRQPAMIAIIGVGCAIALHAQTSTNRATNRTIPERITLTGCVERADQVSAATVGTTVDSLSFVLIKATKGTAADSRTVATGGRPAEANRGNTYRLDADVDTLNPHVGHKVEITGTVTENRPQADAADPSSASNAPKVKVSQVKMIAETCGR